MNKPLEGPDPQVIIVGAGIVGLSCAYFLSLRGFQVTIVDRDLTGDRTSFGNAGAIACSEVMPIAAPGIVWKVPHYLLNPLGPLSIRPSYLWRLLPYLSQFLSAANKTRYEESAAVMTSFLSSAFEDHKTIHQDTGLGHLLNKNGHLWVYRSERLRDGSSDWAIRKRLGYKFEFLNRAGVEATEPALGPLVECAVQTEDWATYSDPKAYVLGLMECLRERGVQLVECDVQGVDGNSIVDANGCRRCFKYLVIAAGAWSHYLSNSLGDYCPLESERGYNTTLPYSGISLRRMVTFAQDHFVATPMSMGLRIGGAIEFAGLNAPPNFSRSEALLRLAKRYFPDLNISGGTQWMGHRPSTPDSLPVIDRASSRANIFYAFGHGHLGLTSSATTGRVIAELLTGDEASLDLTPFRIGRFAA